MDELNAQRRFEFENGMSQIDTAADALYSYDLSDQKRQTDEKPWTKDPNFFKKVRISAVALIKMVLHARSGGNIEVMGLMQGKVSGDTIIIMDAFALPVEGTETRVSAADQANEYIIQYKELIKEVGRIENPIGWYHSHPGYGCWLSGIDVSTQMLNQQYQDPWVAIVVDPIRTISAGKVEIGAFRTYPTGYKPPDEGPSEYQTIPLSKIEDFGVHAKQYYQLDVSCFKSSLDTHLLELLWHKYWINTLSSSSLLTNRAYNAQQIADLAEKIEQAESSLSQGSRLAYSVGPGTSGEKKKEDGPLSKVSRDSSKVSIESAHGLISQLIKNVLFNTPIQSVVY